MRPSQQTARLAPLIAVLGFPVEDYDRIDATFARWHAHGAARDLETIEVWLYCYAHLHVTRRVLQMPRLGAGEADRLVGEVFERMRSQLHTVAEPGLFSHWASVVSKHTFLNGIRRRYEPADLDLSAVDVADERDPTPLPHDRALVWAYAARAIRGLPDSLRHVAELRFLEDRPYDHIADITGYPLGTVRAYAARAARRLRTDPTLRSLSETFDIAPTEEP